MKITEETLMKIEEVFEISLYDWQKDYLLDKVVSKPIVRCNGKSFAYCIKLLLSDGELIPKREIFKYRDNSRWFCGFCLEINEKLVEAGFETRVK